MAKRQLPPFWQWNLIYLRLAIRRVATLKALARLAEITDDVLHTLRTELGVPWVKPLRKFEGMLDLPDFVNQFLDASEKAGLLDPPAPSAHPPVPSNDAPPPSAPPQ
ncbi:MAG TPA: hypothetical protein VGF13_01915 [Verrucomicrobiae bacterium]|jgi:hypothetical protein